MASLSPFQDEGRLSRSRHSRPSVSATFSCPSRSVYGVWDFRRNARPPYHPEHQPHYSERAFYPKQRKRAITLRFRPYGRADLAMVKAAHRGKHLHVGDVLREISASELLVRSLVRRESRMWL